MIPTYCSYIGSYVRRSKGSKHPIPGEHHFVAAYLVPKLYEIKPIVPNFINPDGTKDILGDIVYFEEGSHHLGIEAKLGTIRLTKREFNEWIVNSDASKWPCIFVGVGTKGIGVASWAAFRKAYIASVEKDRPGWVPKPISKGYGPTKAVNLILLHLGEGEKFPYVTEDAEVAANELNFVAALKKCVVG